MADLPRRSALRFGISALIGRSGKACGRRLPCGARRSSYNALPSAEVLEDRTLLAAPHPFDLSTLNGSNGFRLDGIDPNDSSGISVSSAGDVNGDGFADLIIGAAEAHAGGDAYAGETYVVFGKASGFTAALDLSALDGTNGFRLDGIDPGERSGVSVSSAGDVNGDRFADLIIGASLADPSGKSNAGQTYVVFGKASGFSAALDVSDLNGINGFRLEGIDSGDRAGSSVGSAGDVNGDGFDDLIIGADFAGPATDSFAGETYVVFGKPSGFAAAQDLAALDGANGFRLEGIDPGDQSGRSVGSAGDVNGDGFDDLIVGAHGGEPGGDSDAGEARIVYGKSSGFAAAVRFPAFGPSGFRLDGIDAGDRAGFSVSSAGDVNGDGIDDIVIGAPFADAGGDSDAGETYVVFGKLTGFAAAFHFTALDGTNGFRLDGIDSSDYSGWSVGEAGDVNGDGFDDLIIGARRADAAGDLDAGETYVVFGGNFTRSATHLGNASANVLTGNETAEVLVGRRGRDTLVGGGGADVLNGGRGTIHSPFPTRASARCVEAAEQILCGSTVRDTCST